jgi:hypothetical protein
MSETSDIEKKSLEAHVELCAERYRFLENKLETMDSKIDQTATVIREVHDKVETMSSKRQDQLLTWGGSILVALVAVIGYLLATFVVK